MATQPKLTAQLQKIYAVLQATVKPLSAYEILEELRDKGVRSPPTVYRALDKLQAMGLVHRVESLGAFVACRHRHVGVNKALCPFAICTSCGDVQELCDPALARVFQKLGDGFLAEVDHKVIEISGLCHACQGNGKAKRGYACST